MIMGPTFDLLITPAEGWRVIRHKSKGVWKP